MLWRFTWRFLRFKLSEFTIESLLSPESVEKTVYVWGTKAVWDSQHWARSLWRTTVFKLDISHFCWLAFFTYYQVLIQPLLTWKTDYVGRSSLTWGPSIPEKHTGFGLLRGIWFPRYFSYLFLHPPPGEVLTWAIIIKLN